MSSIDSYYDNPSLFNYTFHISLEKKFVYVNNPKCGCTTTKASLNRWTAAASGKTLNYSSLADIHNRAFNPLLTPNQVGPRARSIIVDDTEFYRFTLMREPLDRLASAYASKLSWDSRERELFNIAAGRPADSSLPFTLFLSLIREDSKLRDMNEHWRSQCRQIAIPLLRYDLICLFERLEADLLVIRNTLFPGIELGIFETRERFPENRSSSARVRAAMSSAEIALAREIYAEDLDFYQDVLTARNLDGAKLAAMQTPQPTVGMPLAEEPRLPRILERFESLGDNCEFGFVQRAHGVEVGGLLRWSIAPLPALINTLQSRFEGIFQFDNLVPSANDMVRDVQTGIFFHSSMKSVNKKFIANKRERRKLFVAESAKSKHLVTKLLARLNDKHVIAVYKCNRDVSDAEAAQLSEALAAVGQASLLIVRVGESAGQVIKINDRMLIGSIDKFAPYEKAHDVSLEVWNQIVLNADALVPAPA